MRTLFCSVCLGLLFLVPGCAPDHEVTPDYAFDLQGHRGARGHAPENTIPGFLLALDMGADTIELDVVMTADSQVVVSHEPWMSHEICSTPSGDPVAEDDARSFNIYGMTYAQVAAFDCGVRGNHRFPDQKPDPATKPLLSKALAATEAHLGSANYNVEIKTRGAEGDGVYHPDVASYVRAVVTTIQDAGVVERTTIQSFDPRVLNELHRSGIEVQTAFLVDNDDGLEANLARLDYQPEIFSPNFRLVDQALVDALHDMGMRVIPWTINQTQDMLRMLSLGVDGIITDYPDRGAGLKSAPVSPEQN